jgi:hypothetical protein
MNKTKQFYPRGAWLSTGCIGILALVLIALTTPVYSPLPVRADGNSNPPPFDFNDQYYVQNGIDPPNILQRVGTPSNSQLNWVVDNSNTDATRRNIRVLQTTGGFTHDGKLLYYSIMGFVNPNTFTTDAAGQVALAIANRRQAFIFPIRQADGSYKLSPALGNRRQDNIFDTSGGYLSDDPLGLWILAFVELTPFGTSPQGQQILAPFAAANGVGTDGTAVVTTLVDINNLVQQGVFQIVTRNLDGSQGFPWVI